MPQLAEWDTFYVIVGSSAGALIGLQFVVLTLIAVRPVQRMAEASAAFSTPNIVHFSAALLLSALLRTPWHTLAPAAVLWGAVGLYGIGYEVVVARRMRTQGAYHPVLEDWLFHLVLPLAAYAVLALTAFAASSRERGALFGVGAASLLLLFIGIHNAWDAVTYHVFFRKEGQDDSQGKDTHAESKRHPDRAHNRGGHSGRK